MTRALVLVAVLGCGSKKQDEPAPAPAPEAAAPVVTIDRAALLAGQLPEGAPETEVINAQCRICHSIDYLTQQRLTDAGWKKAIDKMRKFGANLSDADADALVKFAAQHWNRELPDRQFSLAATPPGATPN